MNIRDTHRRIYVSGHNGDYQVSHDIDGEAIVCHVPNASIGNAIVRALRERIGLIDRPSVLPDATRCKGHSRTTNRRCRKGAEFDGYCGQHKDLAGRQDPIPQIIVDMTGGVLEAIYATQPVNLLVVDRDDDCAETRYDLPGFEGYSSRKPWAGTAEVEIKPEMVKAAILAFEEQNALGTDSVVETARLIREYAEWVQDECMDDGDHLFREILKTDAKTAEACCHLGRAMLCIEQAASDPPYRLGGEMCDPRITEIAQRLMWQP